VVIFETLDRKAMLHHLNDGIFRGHGHLLAICRRIVEELIEF
jgi:hypothetical protein